MTPDAQHQPVEPVARDALRLQQDAARLAPVQQDVVGPFVPDLDHRRHDLAQCRASAERRDEAELCRIRRRAVGLQDQREIEVARRRGPGPAAAPAPGGLGAGPDQGAVLGAGAGPALGFLVGAVDRVERYQAIGGRQPQIAGHRFRHPAKSAAAAALAPENSGAG